MTKLEACNYVANELNDRGLFDALDALCELCSLVSVDEWKNTIENAGCQWQERKGFESIEPIILTFEGKSKGFKFWKDAAVWAEEQARNKEVWSKPSENWSWSDMSEICEALGYTDGSGCKCPDFLAGYAAALGRWDGGTSRILLSGGDESANSQ